ncbi:prophage LambdaBa02 protein [Prevotella dentalis DSM 3688]|uniref:Prophage LambdaBa02 protein n=1 Tax=Prevotella dentalis (strain ATCC 49559 / DSM 3688 / JCM 13448 / NCTC 12043 / ES 2772) TaxID=908937 RepID=F9D5M2_PREDD|nr:prophage LambdaBa02 protein [Prevotella dentalis DSM 3688]
MDAWNVGRKDTEFGAGGAFRMFPKVLLLYHNRPHAPPGGGRKKEKRQTRKCRLADVAYLCTMKPLKQEMI